MRWSESSSHGGAWKVAYADFVTAMMAFFLLMWLLNSTTPEQRRGLADYFSPSNAMSRTTSGFGAIFGGHTPNDAGTQASDLGAIQVMNSDAKVVDMPDDDSDTPAEATALRDSGDKRHADPFVPAGPPGGPATNPAEHPGDQVRPASAAGSAGTDAELRAELARRERAAFDDAAKQIRGLVAQDPALADLGRQLSVDITPEGLRIQILDEEHQPMFPTGSAVLSDRARTLLLKVGC
ncbi:MAG: flagellar motor protein MotB [Acetobacteraceae bacterium]